MKTGHGNNLNALRLLLAAAVVISHAWPLALGPATPEPLEILTGRSLGGWAVLMFFFLSGLLISESASRRTTVEFWTARARRIAPGLAVALMVTVVLAVLSGARPDVVSGADYVLRGLTLVSIEHHIDGAFAANPYAGVVNGPLWSLFYEVLAYAICFAVIKAGGLRHIWGALALLAMGPLLYLTPVAQARAEVFAPLFMAYATGMVVWRFRAVLHFGAGLGLVLVLMAPLGGPFLFLAMAWMALVLAFRLPVIRLRGDLSFGMYIYGWPVAQMVLHLIPGLSPLTLAGLSLIATIPFAAASWYLVEAPALRRRTVATLAHMA